MAASRWPPTAHGDVMVAALVDHLWQSVLVLALLAIAATLARRNAAIVRLWIWRIAAIKFLVPFRVLFVIGSWLGYPIRYPGDTAPEYFVHRFALLANYFTPAQARDVAGWPLAACLLLLVIALVPCARFVHERLRDEQENHSHELARAGLDPDDRAPGLGFVLGLTFTAVVLLVLGAPVLAGAVDDRLARHALLLDDARSLRNAEVEMKPAAPGMGARARLVARADGVFIRNVSIQELAGFAYGVNRTFVWGDHFNQRGELDWLVDARYDIRIPGRIEDPGRFDSYAMRVPITRMLALKHGLELYVNDKCQPPCGRYGVNIPEDPL
jgi:hypothetical protein